MPLSGPAYSIRTPRLLVRCFDPRDALLLKSAIDASLDQLVPWLPWAREEPQSLEAKGDVLRHFRARFDLDKDWNYGLFTPDERELVGGLGLHRRGGHEAREMGYWIAKAHGGQGLAAEAVAAVVRVCFEVDRLERVEIHCDESNLRSASIPRKLGFTEEGRLRRVLHGADGTSHLRDAVVFALLADELAGTPVASVPLEAFDATGARVP